MKKDMITARHFSEGEFKRCVPSCSLQDMNQSTMDRLDRARDLAGIPFKLNCAYRTRAWDLSKGRNGNSAHTRGRAVDIAANNSATRMKVVRGLLSAGFTRIGIAKNFVHADDDPTLPQNVMFDYY